jgi:hypothetical protein
VIILPKHAYIILWGYLDVSRCNFQLWRYTITTRLFWNLQLQFFFYTILTIFYIIQPYRPTHQTIYVYEWPYLDKNTSTIFSPTHWHVAPYVSISFNLQPRATTATRRTVGVVAVGLWALRQLRAPHTTWAASRAPPGPLAPGQPRSRAMRHPSRELRPSTVVAASMVELNRGGARAQGWARPQRLRARRSCWGREDGRRKKKLTNGAHTSLTEKCKCHMMYVFVYALCDSSHLRTYSVAYLKETKNCNSCETWVPLGPHRPGSRPSPTSGFGLLEDPPTCHWAQPT